MLRRYKIAVFVAVLVCAGVAFLYIPPFMFGWHSRPEDVARTKQVVSAAAQKLEDRTRAGLPLPATTNDLAEVLDGNVPRDAWGGSLHYQRLSDSHFVLGAMSPYPELLIISYDTRATNSQLAVYPF